MTPAVPDLGNALPYAMLKRVGEALPPRTRATRSPNSRTGRWVKILTHVASEPETWFQIAETETASRSYAAASNLNRGAAQLPDVPGTFQFRSQKTESGHGLFAIYHEPTA